MTISARCCGDCPCFADRVGDASGAGAQTSRFTLRKTYRYLPTYHLTDKAKRKKVEDKQPCLKRAGGNEKKKFETGKGGGG